MTESVQQLIAEAKHRLETLYAERLKGLYVYGSYARGDQSSESDLDLLIVLSEVNEYGAEIDRTSELVSFLSLRYAVSVSRVFLSEEAFRTAHNPFLTNVRREAIAA